MKTITIIIILVLVYLILKKLFSSSDKIWKVAKRNGVKKTNSSNKHCGKCIFGNTTITTIEGKNSVNGIFCEKIDIDVRDDMICSEFEDIPLHGSGKYSHFGN